MSTAIVFDFDAIRARLDEIEGAAAKAGPDLYSDCRTPPHAAAPVDEDGTTFLRPLAPDDGSTIQTCAHA